MPLFIVVFDEPLSAIPTALTEYSPIEVGPGAWLLKSDEMSAAIAAKAGIGGKDAERGGIVLGLNGAYHGYHRSDVWEWLKRYAS